MVASVGPQIGEDIALRNEELRHGPAECLKHKLRNVFVFRGSLKGLDDSNCQRWPDSIFGGAPIAELTSAGTGAGSKAKIPHVDSCERLSRTRTTEFSGCYTFEVNLLKFGG